MLIKDFSTKQQIRDLINNVIMAEGGDMDAQHEALNDNVACIVSGDDPYDDLNYVLEHCPTGYDIYIVKDENFDQWLIPARSEKGALEFIKKLLKEPIHG